VVCRYTEIPNRYPIFSNTDTDTDVGILNTENTENSVRYSPSGAVRCVTFEFETGQLNQSYWPLLLSANRNNISCLPDATQRGIRSTDVIDIRLNGRGASMGASGGSNAEFSPLTDHAKNSG